MKSILKIRKFPKVPSDLVENPGDLGAIDILTIRESKEEGNLYQLTFIDWYSNFAIAKLYDKEIESFNVKYFLQDVVNKILSKYYVMVNQILTDRSNIYKASDLRNSLKNYLKDEFMNRWGTDEIDKCKAFHLLVIDDFYIANFRLKSYRGLEKLQKDLDNWLSDYNRSPCERNYCYGKSPIEVLASMESSLYDSFYKLN